MADFGLAAIIDNPNANDQGANEYLAHEETKFPIRWTAPEAIFDRRFSVKSDVWSFGILVYEIVTMGRQPYAGMTNKDVIENVSNGHRMPNPHNGSTILCPQPLYEEVMLKCWKQEPENRLRFERLADMLDSYETGAGEHKYEFNTGAGKRR